MLTKGVLAIIMNGLKEDDEMKIFDAHVHVFPEKIAEKATKATGDYYKVKMYSVGNVENIKKEMKEGKITRCLIHSTATKPEQVVHINDYIAKLVSENPEFVGFGTMHPDFENIKEETERIKSLGLLGVKIHSDFQDFALDEEKALPIYEAARGKLPILFHVGDKKSDLSHPKRVANVCRLFPDLTVIAAHLGGYSVWDEAEEYLVGKFKNLYLDASSSIDFMNEEQAKRIIKNHGTDKILFGSDFPMHKPKGTVDKLLSLGFSKKETDNILYKNAQKLLGIRF